MDKSFERKYSINVARLGLGKHTDDFHLDDDFFAQVEQKDPIKADIQVIVELEKYETHLDAVFHLSGEVSLPCDRCSDPYPYALKLDERIIYSFDPDMNFEGGEVLYCDSQEPVLKLIQELYDFVRLTIPIRKVPEAEVHLCAPEVLEVLGLDEKGNPLIEESVSEEEPPVDPRWEKLRELKDKLNG